MIRTSPDAVYLQAHYLITKLTNELGETPHHLLIHPKRAALLEAVYRSGATPLGIPVETDAGYPVNRVYVVMADGRYAWSEMQ